MMFLFDSKWTYLEKSGCVDFAILVDPCIDDIGISTYLLNKILPQMPRQQSTMSQ